MLDCSRYRFYPCPFIPAETETDQDWDARPGLLIVNWYVPGGK